MLLGAMCFVLQKSATLVHAPACVCVPRTSQGGLSDTSALEIRSGGGSGLNSLPDRIRTGIRTLRSAAIDKPFLVPQRTIESKVL